MLQHLQYNASKFNSFSLHQKPKFSDIKKENSTSARDLTVKYSFIMFIFFVRLGSRIWRPYSIEQFFNVVLFSLSG